MNCIEKTFSLALANPLLIDENKPLKK